MEWTFYIKKNEVVSQLSDSQTLLSLSCVYWNFKRFINERTNFFFFYMTLDNNASANCVSEIVCFLHYSIRMSSSEKSAIWEDSSSVFWFYFSFSQNPSVSGGCLRICQRGWRTKVVKKEDFIIRSLCQLCWIIENRNGVVHNAFARVLG